jgi:hypothetical protein
MTVQLSKEQIDAIKVELRKYGLNVLPIPGRGKAKAEASEVSPLSAHEAKAVKARITDLQGMRFKTAGIKARLMRNYKTVLKHGYGFRGVTSYQVKGDDGKWYSEGDDGFAKAKRRRAWLDRVARMRKHREYAYA